MVRFVKDRWQSLIQTVYKLLYVELFIPPFSNGEEKLQHSAFFALFFAFTAEYCFRKPAWVLWPPFLYSYKNPQMNYYLYKIYCHKPFANHKSWQ